tara:strand:- start:436 stop:1362 length:927 start_codon:yes stop_codon:yes gene_type:complete
MKKYKNGIDFVIVSYLPKGVEYCKLLVKSIHKYFEGVSYGINIVVNYTNKEDDIRVHKEIFDNDELVSILEGVDQTESQQLSPEGSLHHHGSDRFGKIDNNKTCLGSYYGVWGTNIGIKNGNRAYVCVLDADAIFLNRCHDELVDLAEKYSFIGNRWDPGNLHHADNTIPELGVVKLMLGFSKREFYDDILSEKYVEKGIWSDEPWNVDYRDVGGNLTWYAQEKDLEICVLDNSHWDTEEIRNAFGANWEDVKDWNRSSSGHLLNLPYGEQAWIGDKPIFYHQTRGGYRRAAQLPDWVNACEKYLEEN